MDRAEMKKASLQTGFLISVNLTQVLIFNAVQARVILNDCTLSIN